MPSIDASLATVAHILVPQTRENHKLSEELVGHCREILGSNIGQTREPDLGHLVDIIKRQVVHTSHDTTNALRFSNLLARLLDQPVLSRKHAVLLFLQSLASSAFTQPPVLSEFIPTLEPAPPFQTPIPNRSSPSDVSHPAPRDRSKADILRQYRARTERTGKSQLPEQILLRDALYLLQGISGKYQYIISVQTRSLIHRIAELGHLYSRVSSFVQVKEGQLTVGTIEQSLCHHLQTQLTEYYRLVAVLESHMAVGDNTGSLDGLNSSANGHNIREQETGLTLRRLEVWIDEWRLRMRMMSICVEGAKDVHGGALVSLIHGYTDNGDPFVRKFTDQLLEEVSKPFFFMLQKWLFSGELQDPFSEFFVALNPDLAHLQYLRPATGDSNPLTGDGGFGDIGEDVGPDGDNLESGMRLWEGKYLFKKEMLPRFVGEAFGKKASFEIFSTGRSLNFIRYSCHDSDWITTRNKLSSAGRTLKYSDIGGLEQSIDTAYQIASRRLFEVFFDKFKLLDHLSALKDYLMLGHGDFADQLMETLGPSLSRPANTLYRHNLTATLESAISSSNAQNDPPDVLRRLDARMLEYSHGEIGWDVFTLEYRIDPPIDTVVTSESMINYMRIFSHIWKMRRIESSLAKGWMRIAGGSRTFLKLPELEPYWHQTRIVMAEMIHVIRQIQMYTQIEVIAVRWKNLLTFVQKKEGDLDSLIAAHQIYLDELVNKTLMISSKQGKTDVVLDRVRQLFHVILQYREATDEFYNFCLAEAARRDQLLDQARGVFTGPAPEPSTTHDDVMSRALDRIKDYGTSFTEGAQAIVTALQGHTDPDCRDLAARLNFTRYYSPNKDREQQQRI
ncbi:gamma-tubulin complex DGRIP91/SPC98 component [Ramaria rubella]|nr:gamma-tubulin complex DGRIP91/SPC98 component [Ramaria rubella]